MKRNREVIPGFDIEGAPDEAAALKYAIANQSKRRNLEGPELWRLILAVDQRKTAGRPEKLASGEANYQKSASVTSKIIGRPGAGRATVERLRTVADYARLGAEDPASSDSSQRKTSTARRPRGVIPYCQVRSPRGGSSSINSSRLSRARVTDTFLPEYPVRPVIRRGVRVA
jgi:hypothetical protein